MRKFVVIMTCMLACFILPDGFTYEFKEPDNADGIVVTSKK